MRIFQSHRIWLAFCCVMTGLLLVGCDKGGERAAEPPKVSFTVVENEALTLVTELPGRVSAYTVSEIRPQISGIVQERLFEEGSDVVAGQPLYQIDPAMFRAEVNSARANLAKAEARKLSAKLLSERYEKLVTLNAVSRQERDDAVAARLQAEADVAAAKEALTTAEINLGYTGVTAPVSGRVGRSYVTPGALVTQNQEAPLSTIQHLDRVYVDITQANVELLRLSRIFTDREHGGKGSATVQLRLEDGTPYALPLLNENAEPRWIEGELLFSEVSIDRSTGAVTLRASFPNPDHILLPGMHVRAPLVEASLESALLVPQRTVLRDSRGNAFVYVLHEETHSPNAANIGDGPIEGRLISGDGEQRYTVARREVAIARSIGNRWLVKSGLEPGDRLLYEGHIKTAPGGTVRGTDIGRSDGYSAALRASK